LNDAATIVEYYGFKPLPPYSPEESFDTVYVSIGIFQTSEQKIYEELRKHGLDDTNMLKIYPNNKIAIFKKSQS
jgi:hypothetical protein